MAKFKIDKRGSLSPTMSPPLARDLSPNDFINVENVQESKLFGSEIERMNTEYSHITDPLQ